jgi:hypothetical protein
MNFHIALRKIKISILHEQNICWERIVEEFKVPNRSYLLLTMNELHLKSNSETIRHLNLGLTNSNTV